jgi:hypothetical protein
MRRLFVLGLCASVALPIALLAVSAGSVWAQSRPQAIDVEQYIQQYRTERMPALEAPKNLQPPGSLFGAQAVPVVRVMPSSYEIGSYLAQNVDDPAAPYTWPGRTFIIWGRVDGGEGDPTQYRFQLDFDDGTAPVSGFLDGTAGRRHGYIAEAHTYAQGGPKTARLTVTDGVGQTAFRDIQIFVEPLTGNERDHDMLLRRNAAIQDGLRWMYLQHVFSGSWYSYAPHTAAAVAAFEMNKHYPDNNWETDIYAEFVRQGLEWIMLTLSSTAIDVEPWGDPDSNGNGIGIGGTQHGSAYEQGLIMYAIALSRDSSAVVQGGAFAGRTYKGILTDMVDLLAWSQGDSDYCEGGWRYTVWYPGCDSDNSAVQWATIGLDAAERPQNEFNVPAAAFVKPELQKWLNYSRCSDGGYGYTWADYWCNAAKTGSGMFSEYYCGLNIPDIHNPGLAPVIQGAMSVLDNNWCGYEHWPNLYAMYAIKKALADMKIELLNGTRDWYQDYCRFLLYGYTDPCGQGYDSWHQVINPAAPDLEGEGYWNGDWNWLGSPFATTPWAVLILSPGISCDLYAVGTASPQGACPGSAIGFDGRPSYSTCPDHQVVSWLWDFDASNGANIHNPDATGAQVVKSDGYALPPGQQSATYHATLWVIDQSPDPLVLPDTSATTVVVTVGVENHPPVACLNGPFTACVGEPIWLDACCSFDPDDGSGGCPRDSVVSYEWDFGGDGSVDLVTATCRPADPLVFYNETTMSIKLSVVDSYGLRSSQADVNLIWSSFRDLSVHSNEVVFDPPFPSCGTAVQICVPVHATVNGGAPPIAETKVKIYHDEVTFANLICSQTLTNLQNGQVVQVCCDWLIPDATAHNIIVVADAEGQVQECVETDNRASRLLECGACTGGPSLLLPTTWYLGWPDTDPGTVRWYLGGGGAFDVHDVDPSSLMLNGTIPTSGVVILPSFDGFEGAVLAARFPRGPAVHSIENPLPGQPATLVLSGRFLNGACLEASGTVLVDQVEPAVTDASGEAGRLYSRFVLEGIRPNPARRSATISLGLPSHGQTSVAIFDAGGRLIRMIADGAYPAGRRLVTWDGLNAGGKPVPAGVYFVRAEFGGTVLQQRIVIVE